MATSIDTWSADAGLWKHEKYDSDDSAQRAMAAALDQQRGLGRTVTDIKGVYTITDDAGALVMRISLYKFRG